MTDLITCPNCGKKIEEFVVYCGFCGEVIQKEKKKANKVNINPKTGEIISTTPDTITIKANDKEIQKDRPWYKPLKRKRAWYNPIEWFFWIGWSLYVVFRFLLIEIFRYLKWCVCWGRPDELKE